MASPISVLQLPIKEHFLNNIPQSSPLTLIMTFFLKFLVLLFMLSFYTNNLLTRLFLLLLSTIHSPYSSHTNMLKMQILSGHSDWVPILRSKDKSITHPLQMPASHPHFCSGIYHSAIAHQTPATLRVYPFFYAILPTPLCMAYSSNKIFYD